MEMELEDKRVSASLSFYAFQQNVSQKSSISLHSFQQYVNSIFPNLC